MKDELAYSANYNYREGYDDGMHDGRDDAIKKIAHELSSTECACGRCPANRYCVSQDVKCREAWEAHFRKVVEG